jgi:uncharacterized RDD family membrane protein YckC
MTPAGLRWRAAAWLADTVLLLPVIVASAWPLGRAAVQQHAALQARMLERLDAALMAGVVSPVELVVILLRDPVLWTQAEALVWVLLAIATLTAIIGACWFIGFEASPWQATPGKRWLGLRVQAMHGGGLSARQAVVRWLVAGLSTLLLHAGHALIGLRADHRAWHDLAAGSQVVFARNPAPVELPPMARGLLALPLVALLALVAWFAWQAAQLVGLALGG